MFKNFLVTWAKQEGLPKVSIYGLKYPYSFDELKLPDQFCSVKSGANIDFNSNILRFTYSSPTVFHKDMIYDMEKSSMAILK